jgi:hypothetical protein
MYLRLYYNNGTIFPGTYMGGGSTSFGEYTSIASWGATGTQRYSLENTNYDTGGQTGMATNVPYESWINTELSGVGYYMVRIGVGTVSFDSMIIHSVDFA